MNNTEQIMQLLETIDNDKSQTTFTSSFEPTNIRKIVEENHEKGKSSSATFSTVLVGTDANDFPNHQVPLPFEEQYFDESLELNEEIRNRYIDKYVPKLVESMRSYNYDQESEDKIWPIVDDIVDRSFSILGDIFQKICLQNYDQPNILCAVAKCLCSFELDQTAGWGPMILLSLLIHKDDNVKEYAVFLLENWEDRSLLPILKNIDCYALWLREYINSVISNLEG